jgi:CDP-paratose 2-epimerase
VKFFHGDLRLRSDLEHLPYVDLVVDASANPSVLAGVDGKVSTRQLIEHNLNSTVNLLEFCRLHKSSFVLSQRRMNASPPIQ